MSWRSAQLRRPPSAFTALTYDYTTPLRPGSHRVGANAMPGQSSSRLKAILLGGLAPADRLDLMRCDDGLAGLAKIVWLTPDCSLISEVADLTSSKVETADIALLA